MNNVTPDQDRFEDRLLAAILGDFDVLTADASPAPAGVRRIGHGVPARRVVPALVASVAAAALIAGVVVEVGTRTPGDVTPTTAASTGMTHAHLVLYQLASASIAAPAVTGPYVVLTETDTDTDEVGSSERTTVVNTQTGASTTYQQPYVGTDAPAVLTEGPDPTSTEAWYAALPTDPVALRAKLLSIAEQQAGQAAQAMQQQQQQAEATTGKAFPKSIGAQPTPTDDDYVYQEADELLWSPLVSPTLRSALYKVLAATSGFSITTGVTDPAGRPAIEMTRHYTGIPETDTTYEDPTTGAVLAQVWVSGGQNGPPNSPSAAQAAAQGHGTATNYSESETITAVYQPVTSSNTIPPNPYAN
jgi:hypothetical protein